MECSDETPYYFSIAAAGLLAAAISFCVIAGVLNASFFGAPGAPGVMGAAFGVTMVAGVLMGAARSAFTTYEQCIDSSRCLIECGSNFRQARSALTGAVSAISAAAALITAAIPISWIPWGGTLPIGVALAGVVVASVAMTIGIAYMYGAESCAKECSVGHAM